MKTQRQETKECLENVVSYLNLKLLGYRQVDGLSEDHAIVTTAVRVRDEASACLRRLIRS